MDTDRLLDNLGWFSFQEKEGAIPHNQSDPTTFDWFMPENIITLEECQELGMNLQESYTKIEEQRQRNYKLACTYVEDWMYYDLHASVYVDNSENPGIPTLKLIDEVVSPGIVLISDLQDDIIPQEIEKAISDLFDRSTVVLKSYYDALTKMVITPTHIYPDLVPITYDLENYGASFLQLPFDVVITGDLIRSWVDATRELDTEDVESVLETPLSTIYRYADQLADFYTHDNLLTDWGTNENP
jgi:hypothetical protein